jgi:hypothetical protein
MSGDNKPGINAHGMAYVASMNENWPTQERFSREGAKARRTFFSCLSCVSWFKNIFTVRPALSTFLSWWK